MTDRLLRITEVVQMTSISKSHIYTLIKRAQFPSPISLGRKCSRWREEDVVGWIANTKARGGLVPSQPT